MMPDTYTRFTLRVYPHGHSSNPVSRWFFSKEPIPWHKARDRLVLSGIVRLDDAGKTFAPGGWMLSVAQDAFFVDKAEPLP